MKIKALLLLALLQLNIVGVQYAKGQDYTIYPVPHEQIALDGTARIGNQLCIVAEQGIDEATLKRAEQVAAEHGLNTMRSARPQKNCSNLIMGVNGSRGIADKEASRLKLNRRVFGLPKYDRHILSLYADKNGTAQLIALGESTDAVFCALASLEQMLDQVQAAATGAREMACTVLYDWADLRDRGIIEGYYGVPYSAEVTKDLFRFMARYKMNTYMYGAKSDPYHSKLWAEPYPTSITPDQERIGYLTQDMLRGITSEAHACKVNFIWAIHPGTAFTDKDNSEVMDKIMEKFGYMHQLGVRQFGVFVDDVGVPSDDATLRLGADRLSELQQRIENRWNTATAQPADTVKPLHYVPQLYAFSWVAQPQAERFFNALGTVPDKVRIYITGRAVWTVPNNDDLATVGKYLGHETSWWWNYPCNDNDMSKLFTMDTYANFHDEKHITTLDRMEKHLIGTPTLIANPMQQGEVSKIALFGVADYAWNTAAFDNNQNWEAAIRAVVSSDYAPVLRRLAPYLRYFDGDALSYHATNYRNSVKEGQPRPAALINTLRQVVKDCEQIETMEKSPLLSDRLFLADMKPWVLKLKAMATETISRLQGQPTEAIAIDTDPAFQFEILTGLGDGISLSMMTAEPATEVLRPLLDMLRERDAQKEKE